MNGQKVWNTLAHLADWGMLVTRSNPDVPKHKGMTYFALDMAADGVEVRPLRQITGEAEFNEVYLTDARIPDARSHRRRGGRVARRARRRWATSAARSAGPRHPSRGADRDRSGI